MAMKFTFKKEASEIGLARVGNPYPDTIIKHNKKQVGTIVAPNWMTEDQLWRVRFAVTKNDTWRWMIIKEKFATEPEAREWIQQNAERIAACGLYYLED